MSSNFINSVFIAVASTVALASIHAAEPAFGKQPNVILMMTDDQGYAPVGRHGHPWINTPHLNALYDKSTRFTRFLVSPTCSPTRASLMSGRHPLKNGITHTILERERMALKTTTLPQVLATAGYTSGIFGKVASRRRGALPTTQARLRRSLHPWSRGHRTSLQMLLCRRSRQQVFQPHHPPQRVLRKD